MNELPRSYSVWTTENDATRYMPGTMPPEVRFFGPAASDDAYRLVKQCMILFPEVPWSIRSESDSRTDIPLTEFHDCERDHPASPGFPPVSRCRFYGHLKTAAAQVTVTFTVDNETTAGGLLRLIAADSGLVPCSTTVTDATGLHVLNVRTHRM
jgi:hypothetical protein